MDTMVIERLDDGGWQVGDDCVYPSHVTLAVGDAVVVISERPYQCRKSRRVATIYGDHTIADEWTEFADNELHIATVRFSGDGRGPIGVVVERLVENGPHLTIVFASDNDARTWWTEKGGAQ